MKEKIQWIAWESCKLIFVIAFVISICCNIIWMYSFTRVDNSLTVIYSDIHDMHIELLKKLEEK